MKKHTSATFPHPTTSPVLNRLRNFHHSLSKKARQAQVDNARADDFTFGKDEPRLGFFICTLFETISLEEVGERRAFYALHYFQNVEILK